MWFKTSHVVVSESKNNIFVSWIVFLLFTLKFKEVILPHLYNHVAYVVSPSRPSAIQVKIGEIKLELKRN